MINNTTNNKATTTPNEVVVVNDSFTPPPEYDANNPEGVISKQCTFEADVIAANVAALDADVSKLSLQSADDDDNNDDNKDEEPHMNRSTNDAAVLSRRGW